MLMHVGAKRIAIAGLLVAASAVFLILSSVIESNSLFLIAAASFCVGIAIREWGIGFGAGFLSASTLVNLMVAPNKFYCISFAAMGLYLLLSECLCKKIMSIWMLWVGKYVIFNVIYIPAVLFFQELLFAREVTGALLVVFLLAGQLALYVYDKAHLYFQNAIWGKLRVKVL